MGSFTLCRRCSTNVITRSHLEQSRTKGCAVHKREFCDAVSGDSRDHSDTEHPIYPWMFMFSVSGCKWASFQIQTKAQQYFSECQSRQQIKPVFLSCVAIVGSSADSYECHSSKRPHTVLISLNNTILQTMSLSLQRARKSFFKFIPDVIWMHLDCLRGVFWTQPNKFGVSCHGNCPSE